MLRRRNLSAHMLGTLHSEQTKRAALEASETSLLGQLQSSDNLTDKLQRALAECLTPDHDINCLPTVALRARLQAINHTLTKALE